MIYRINPNNERNKDCYFIYSQKQKALRRSERDRPKCSYEKEFHSPSTTLVETDEGDKEYTIIVRDLESYGHWFGDERIVAYGAAVPQLTDQEFQEIIKK